MVEKVSYFKKCEKFIYFLFLNYFLFVNVYSIYVNIDFEKVNIFCDNFC